MTRSITISGTTDDCGKMIGLIVGELCFFHVPHTVEFCPSNENLTHERPCFQVLENEQDNSRNSRVHHQRLAIVGMENSDDCKKPYVAFNFKARSYPLFQLNAILCEMTYTWWVFNLPKNWHPDLKGQGPFIPRHFRIFCFFLYNLSLFVNCGQFFNGLLLYSCVDRGIKDKEGTQETSRFYIIFSLAFCVLNLFKFLLLFFYLDYGVTFCFFMCVPEIIVLITGIFTVAQFQKDLVTMERVEDTSPYMIGKNGKIIFDP